MNCNGKKIRDALGNRPIVLIGLMGAGKTSVGRRLAKLLEMDFADADNEIERAAGKSISEIFSDHGEAYFRDGERRVIARMLGEGPRVLATGGGAFMDEQTRRAILDEAVSIWLRADLDLLYKRVRKRNHRPLLQGKDARAVLARLMEERYPVYAEADLTVETRDAPHEFVVNEAATQLARFLSGCARGEGAEAALRS